MDEIRLRPATRTDVPLLEAWDDEPHVAASDPDDDWGWDRMIEGALPGLDNYIAEAEGRPIGVVQILDTHPDASRYWGETGLGIRAIDIWIGPRNALGRGFGTQMMRRALEICFADPDVRMVLVDPLASNADAIRFYQRIGFSFLENRMFDDALCAVHQLLRDDFNP